MEKIRVGIVNYLNTKPLLYGLLNDPALTDMELSGDYPANVASQLAGGQLDLALVPVAALPLLPSYQLVGTHCIATERTIASVCLFSDVPLQQIDRIHLDYQSRSSVALLKILLREYWQLQPLLLSSESDDFIDRIKGNDAALVIGDRALSLRGRHAYCYDMGEAWHAYAQLPFVFAVWASTRPLAVSFTERFDAANSLGLQCLDKVIAPWQPSVSYDLHTYYTQNISYRLDDRKRKAIDYFLSLLG